MALTTVCTGFEFGSTAGWATGNAGNKIFDTITGTPAIITTSPRTGTYCLEVSSTAATQSVQWNTSTLGSSQNRARFVLSVYFPTSAPTADVRIAVFTAAFNAELWYRGATTGTLGVCREAGTFTNGSSLSANAWHTIEFYVDMSTTTWTIDWWVDRTQQTTATIGGASVDTVTGFELGCSFNAQTLTARYDDVVVWCDTAAITGPKGEHTVQALKVDTGGTVSTVGATTDFNTFTGATPTLAAWNATTARNSIDEIPVNTGTAQDGIAQINAVTTNAVNVPMTTYTLASGEAVAALRILVAGWQASTASASIGLRTFNGTTETILLAAQAHTNLGNNTATPGWICRMATLANFDTQAEVDALVVRVGFSGDATPDIGFGAVLGELAVSLPPPDANVTASVVAATATIPTPAIVKELHNTFEGGSNGTAITTANSGGTSGDAFDALDPTSLGVGALREFSSTQKKSGTLSFHAVAPSSAGRSAVVWSTSMGSRSVIYGRFYAWHAAQDGGLAGGSAFFRAFSTTTSRGYVSLDGSGHLAIYNSAGSVIAASVTTAVVPTSTWYRVEFKIDLSASGTWELRYYNNAALESTTATETKSGSAANFGGAGDTFAFGHVTTDVGTNVYLDDIGISSGAFLGPVGAVSGDATATPATVAATSTVPTPAISAGSTVTPSTVTATTSVPAPVLPALPGTVAATSTIPTPGVTVAATAVPTVVAALTSIPAPVLKALPGTVAATSTIPAPSITVAAIATPTRIASIAAIPVPGVITGSTVSGPAVAASSTIPVPGVIASSIVAPTVVAASSTVPTPSIGIGGGANPSAPVVAAIGTVPTPTIRADSVLAATPVAGTSSVPVPAFTSPAIAAPSTVAASASIPAPVIRAGSTVTSTTVAGTSSVPAPAVSVRVAITPTVVSGTSVVPAPAIRTTSIVGGAVVAATTTIAAPTVAIGTLVQPSTVVAIASVPGPSIRVDAIVLPTTVGGVTTVPTPTLPLAPLDRQLEIQYGELEIGWHVSVADERWTVDGIETWWTATRLSTRWSIEDVDQRWHTRSRVHI